MTPATLAYNGFEAGGDDYDRVIASIEGLDMPSVNAADSPSAEGTIGGIDGLDARTVNVTLEVSAASQADWYQTSAILRTATNHRSDDIPLTFRLHETGPLLRLYCRPRRRSIPVDARQAYANVTCELQWYAPDPRIYSDAEHSDTTTAPAVPEGFTFPRVYPYDFGDAGSAEVINAHNDGDAPAPWTAVVYGPCEEPTIIGPGGSLRWEGTLGDGESLHFDAHPNRQTVLVGGTSSQYALISDDSDWWLLAPGSNNVVLESGDGSGLIEFRWRDTFWAAV